MMPLPSVAVSVVGMSRRPCCRGLAGARVSNAHPTALMTRLLSPNTRPITYAFQLDVVICVLGALLADRITLAALLDY